MYAIHRQAAPPSGVAFSLSARVTPSCLQGTSTSTSKIVRNLITATNDFLQLFEVVEEVVHDASIAAVTVNGAVNGKQDVVVEEREQPDEKKPQESNGYKQNGSTINGEEASTTRARLRFVREYRLHGTITGLQRIQTIDTARDGLDRLLVSFRNAKTSLLEWSSEQYDLVTASLHTFEKLPHLIQGDLTGYRPLLRVDPLSRCAGLLLPQDALAITPFFQDQIELEGAEEGMASLPYAPSSVIELTEISPQLKHVIDFVFLAGFNEPTLAILTQPEQTWTGRLENAKDVTQLFLITIDVTSTPPSSTIISQTSSLPYDCRHLTACPRDLGGVIITTNNALIHVDQAGKRTSASMNPWANLVSDSSKFELVSEEPLPLEHSSLMFITNDVALLFIRDGRVRAVKVQRDGRTISKIDLLKDSLENTVSPSSIELIRSHLSPKGADGATQACYAFVGSLLGDSQLLKVNFRTVLDEALLQQLPSEAAKVEEAAAMEEDEDDIDIYGSAEAKESALTDAREHRIAAASRFTVSVNRCFDLPAYGPIRAATLGLVEEDGTSELVACTGDEVLGGLTVIHRSVLPAKQRKLDLDHSTESIWTLQIRNLDGVSQTWLLTSSEGETQVYTLVGDDTEQPEYWKTFAKTTLSAATFRDQTAIVYVLRDNIVIVDANFRELQKLPLPKDAKVKSAVVAGSYVLVEREEASPLLFRDNAGKLESISWPEEVPFRATLFEDIYHVYPAVPRSRLRGKRSELYKARSNTHGTGGADSMNDDDIYGESVSAEAATTAAKDEMTDEDISEEEDQVVETEAWLYACTQQGVLKIFALPDFECVFVSGDILTQPTVIEDTQQDQCFEELPEDIVLEQMKVVYLGKNNPKPHLVLLLEDGTLTVYESFEDFGYSTLRPGARLSMGIRWVKVLCSGLGTVKKQKSTGDDSSLGPAQRHLISFPDLNGYHGMFITGDTSSWIIKDDIAPARLFENALQPTYGFTAYADRCLLSLGEEVVVGQLPKDTCFARQLPFTKVVQGRLYTDIVYHPESECFAAISTFPAPFEIFQDEGAPLHPYDAEQSLQPTGPRSALELIEPGSWRTVEGYEFRQYETALSVANVTLETKSTVSGLTEFLAVGTIISRGEDLASRGALYIFEVVSVKPFLGEITPRRSLRLLFTEDLKAPLANVTALNHYLLHSVGLKIYAKAFDQDERLLAVGFLDVGVHTTCIRTLKNLILVGDAIKGLGFIAFQEEPYRFVSLGREVVDTPVVTADFLVSEGKVQLVASDMHGNVRIYEYDPLRAETQGGQRLLPRIEFHAGSEAATSIPFARAAVDDPKQSGILYLHIDGSLSTIVPVRDAVYKRLQLLERQVIRHTHHFAGLNPRAYRTVHNAFVPRPLTKGLLDGDLLSTYSMLSTVKQQQLADPLGSDSDTLNYNIRSLKAPW